MGSCWTFLACFGIPVKSGRACNTWIATRSCKEWSLLRAFCSCCLDQTRIACENVSVEDLVTRWITWTASAACNWGCSCWLSRTGNTTSRHQIWCNRLNTCWSSGCCRGCRGWGRCCGCGWGRCSCCGVSCYWVCENDSCWLSSGCCWCLIGYCWGNTYWLNTGRQLLNCLSCDYLGCWSSDCWGSGCCGGCSRCCSCTITNCVLN